MKALTDLKLADIFIRENLGTAMEHLRLKKGGCGSDGVTLQQFETHWQLHGKDIAKQIKAGDYIPDIAQEVEIITKDNKKRKVYRFTWTDRLIQRLIYQVLNPLLEAQFSKFSFAFQAGKGTEQAVLYAANFIQQGGEFVAEIDVQDYYNNIDRELLEECLTNLIPDAEPFALIRQYIYCPTDTKQNQGVLQGSFLSCIFANLYLHTFDEWLEQRGINFCRHCDDINLYAQTRVQADCLLREARYLLENTYKIKDQQ